MSSDNLCEINELEYSASGNTVSMNLSPGTTVAPLSLKPGSVTLTFEDKEKTKAWERDMMLWKEDTAQGNAPDESYLSLVTVWKVEDFDRRLNLSKVPMKPGPGRPVKPRRPFMTRHPVGQPLAKMKQLLSDVVGLNRVHETYDSSQDFPREEKSLGNEDLERS